MSDRISRPVGARAWGCAAPFRGCDSALLLLGCLEKERQRERERVAILAQAVSGSRTGGAHSASFSLSLLALGPPVPNPVRCPLLLLPLLPPRLPNSDLAILAQNEPIASAEEIGVQGSCTVTAAVIVLRDFLYNSLTGIGALAVPPLQGGANRRCDHGGQGER